METPNDPRARLCTMTGLDAYGRTDQVEGRAAEVWAHSLRRGDIIVHPVGLASTTSRGDYLYRNLVRVVDVAMVRTTTEDGWTDERTIVTYSEIDGALRSGDIIWALDLAPRERIYHVGRKVGDRPSDSDI